MTAEKQNWFEKNIIRISIVISTFAIIFLVIGIYSFVSNRTKTVDDANETTNIKNINTTSDSSQTAAHSTTVPYFTHENSLGDLGDYMGGVAGVVSFIFSVFGLYYVYQTFQQQKTQNEKLDEELKKQRNYSRYRELFNDWILTPTPILIETKYNPEPKFVIDSEKEMLYSFEKNLYLIRFWNLCKFLEMNSFQENKSSLFKEITYKLSIEQKYIIFHNMIKWGEHSNAKIALGNGFFSNTDELTISTEKLPDTKHNGQLISNPNHKVKKVPLYHNGQETEELKEFWRLASSS